MPDHVQKLYTDYDSTIELHEEAKIVDEPERLIWMPDASMHQASVSVLSLTH